MSKIILLSRHYLGFENLNQLIQRISNKQFLFYFSYLQKSFQQPSILSNIENCFRISVFSQKENALEFKKRKKKK